MTLTGVSTCVRLVGAFTEACCTIKRVRVFAETSAATLGMLVENEIVESLLRVQTVTAEEQCFCECDVYAAV